MTPHARQRGLSLPEVIAVLAILFVLVPFIGSLLRTGSRSYPARSYCLNNLKLIGRALDTYQNTYAEKCPYGPMGAVQTDPSDPMSMKGGLFNGGAGLLDDEKVFQCPSGDPTYCPTTSQYLRSWWAAVPKIPYIVIAGDYQNPLPHGTGNHNREYSNFLFRDGHTVGHAFPDTPSAPLNATNIEGVPDIHDDMYNTVGDAAAGSAKRTALIYNDG